MASLTGDAEVCSDLANELSRADPVTLETQDSEDEGSDPEEWTPDPKDAVTGQYPQWTHKGHHTRLDKLCPLLFPVSAVTSL